MHSFSAFSSTNHFSIFYFRLNNSEYFQDCLSCGCKFAMRTLPRAIRIWKLNLSRVTGNIYLFLFLCLVIYIFSYPLVYPPTEVVSIIFSIFCDRPLVYFSIPHLSPHSANFNLSLHYRLELWDHLFFDDCLNYLNFNSASDEICTLSNVKAIKIIFKISLKWSRFIKFWRSYCKKSQNFNVFLNFK